MQVDTTDIQLSNVVDSTEMTELPLIGRGFTGLELILPGVQASSDRFGTYSVSGGQTQQSEYLINGADTNDIALNTVAIQSQSGCDRPVQSDRRTAERRI